MKRVSVFVYGVLSYVTFFATFLYMIGFVGNLVVPKSIDSAPVGPFGQALLINSALLGIFAISHSVMARPAFKEWWTRIIPEEIERNTYVLVSSLALILLVWQWQPMGGIIWNVENPLGRGILLSLFAFGWGLVLLSTFLINHFDLFGLRQSYLALRGRAYTPLEFGTPGLYKIVRHPLYVGWFFAFWAAPTMTAAHLVFALATTGYILIAIQLEERDLVSAHKEFADYQRRVPMLIPRLPGRQTPESAATQHKTPPT